MGTLYRRFPTKDQLIEAIIDQRFCELDEAFDAAAAHDDAWEAFAGTAKLSMRVKCALLGWMAWKDATAQVVASTGFSKSEEEQR